MSLSSSARKMVYYCSSVRSRWSHMRVSSCAMGGRSLSPKAFQLLLLLIENRSRAMSERVAPAPLALDLRPEANLAGLVAEIRRRWRTQPINRRSCARCTDSDIGSSVTRSRRKPQWNPARPP